jgi:hypothetical protein
MSITAILMLIIGAVAALFGGMAGHGLGKSSGRKEGATEAIQQQEIIQAKATVHAVQERNDVETKIAATPRDDLDRELSEFSRPD